MAGHAKTALRPLAGADFRRELESESRRAIRGRCPLSLVLFAPKFQDARDKEANARELLRRIAPHMSPCDSLGLLPEMRHALLLPGAGVFGAQNIASGILQSLEQSGIACTAGIASADFSENAGAETLLQQAVVALREIKGRNGAIGVYREQADTLALRKTLVHSHEKRFLFSGGE
ncbi:MAG: hypothetical protein LBH94_02655 [Deltaproteobacteria bacterium]|jgi:hypothetical protein|nr:hypothetical protein [Deltaproteobacteria bacterium]